MTRHRTQDQERALRSLREVPGQHRAVFNRRLTTALSFKVRHARAKVDQARISHCLAHDECRKHAIQAEFCRQ
jgi:hypothetical protein